jgi:hydrogenase maturation protein HypF
MLQNAVNSPLASSCGRLFDAVAAAIGICRDQAAYEGQAAIELEAMVDEATLYQEDEALAYPFAIPRLGKTGIPYIEPLAMWQAVLGDLILATPPAVMAARFHKGLARVIAAMVLQLSRRNGEVLFDTIALSGGVFQNKILLEQVVQRLQQQGFKVLCHRQVPASDGGLALGQAVVAAGRALRQNGGTCSESTFMR